MEKHCERHDDNINRYLGKKEREEFFMKQFLNHITIILIYVYLIFIYTNHFS